MTAEEMRKPGTMRSSIIRMPERGYRRLKNNVSSLSWKNTPSYIYKYDTLPCENCQSTELNNIRHRNKKM